MSDAGKMRSTTQQLAGEAEQGTGVAGDASLYVEGPAQGTAAHARPASGHSEDADRNAPG